MKVFFETQPDEKLKKSIERCNIDKFKPIISFLKGEKDTENRYRVGLAAILVDFKPRPYSLYQGVNIKESKNNEIENKTKSSFFIIYRFSNLNVVWCKYSSFFLKTEFGKWL